MYDPTSKHPVLTRAKSPERREQMGSCGPLGGPQTLVEFGSLPLYCDSELVVPTFIVLLNIFAEERPKVLAAASAVRLD
jgi:hypothetical protein